MGPTVTPIYVVRHNHWCLAWGTETFYDEKRNLMTWDTKQEAIDWVKINRPDLKIKENDG
jgi:hypothetical protein